MDTTGCYGPVAMDHLLGYSVKMFSEARVNVVGANYNTVEVMAADPANVQYDDVVRGPGWNPPNVNSTINFTTAVAAQWSVAAAAGLALHLSQAGMINQHVSIYVADATPPCSGDCISNGMIFLVTSQNKYLIAHELGHLQERWHNGGVGAYYNANANPDNCYTSASTGAGHEMNSKENQTIAAYEGFATFYTALAFNERTDVDASCEVLYWGNIDWDLSGSGTSSLIHCNAAPEAGLATADYLGDVCNTPHANLAVEYDYLRFLWDMTTAEAITPDNLLEVWDEAGPDAWTDTTDVELALRNASATAPNFGTAWANQATANGVDH